MLCWLLACFLVCPLFYICLLGVFFIIIFKFVFVDCFLVCPLFLYMFAWRFVFVFFNSFLFAWLIDWSIGWLVDWLTWFVLFLGFIGFDALRPCLASHEHCDPYAFLLVRRGFAELVSVMARFRNSVPIGPRSPGDDCRIPRRNNWQNASKMPRRPQNSLTIRRVGCMILAVGPNICID